MMSVWQSSLPNGAGATLPLTIFPKNSTVRNPNQSVQPAGTYVKRAICPVMCDSAAPRLNVRVAHVEKRRALQSVLPAMPL